MKESDHRQFVCGARVVICTKAYTDWRGQRDCTGAVKSPYLDKCWYCDGDGICNRDRMEHEGA